MLAGRSITHRYEYDAAGRVIAHVDPEGHRTSYTKDGGGRLTDIVSPDAGHVRQRFDQTGRLIERIDATGARVAWSHDAIGRVLREQAFAVDGTQVSDVRRHYDHGGPFAHGQLVAVDDDAGRVEFTHDARGRIIHTLRRFDTPRGAVTLAAAHEYDAQGRPLRDIYPDGSSLEHAYTARGLEAPGAFADASYDALARWHHMSLAPGVELTRDLDHTGRVLGQRVTRGGAVLLDLAHRYDIAGQLAETRDHLGAEDFSLSQTHVYDDLHRLVASTAHGKTLRWRYSDDGNLLEQAGRALTYDPARPHAAAGLGAQHLTYDDAGQLAEVAGEGPLAAGAWRFDPHGRVQSFVAEDGRRVEHVHAYTGERAIRREYDARNNLEHETLYFTRAAEVRDGQLVRWIFFAGERIAESPVPMPRGGFAELPVDVAAAVHPHRGTPSPLGLVALVVLALVALALLVRQFRHATRPRRWAPAAALVLAALSCRHHDDAARPLVSDEHTRYHVADRLGSAALVLDHQGRPLARDDAEPYGAARLAWRSGDTAGPTYRFTGKEDDPLSGAIAIGARHYLPALGRWASPDPLYLLRPDERLDEPGERNLYRYSANNPIANTDPTGLSFWSKLVKVVRKIASGADAADAFADNVQDVRTLFGSGSSWHERLLAGLSPRLRGPPSQRQRRQGCRPLGKQGRQGRRRRQEGQGRRGPTTEGPGEGCRRGWYRRRLPGYTSRRRAPQGPQVQDPDELHRERETPWQLRREGQREVPGAAPDRPCDAAGNEGAEHELLPPQRQGHALQPCIREQGPRISAMTNTIKDRFDDLEWHDATLLWIELDRRDPGNRDEIALVIEWPDGRRNRLVFTDCYLLEARMNFGIIASESLLSATCSADSPEVNKVRETCRRYGADFPDLHLFEIETNSTGSRIHIVARGFDVREPPDDSWFPPRETDNGDE